MYICGFSEYLNYNMKASKGPLTHVAIEIFMYIILLN